MKTAIITLILLVSALASPADDHNPVRDNLLYQAWPATEGVQVRFARTERISGGIPTAESEVRMFKSTVTYKLYKVTPTELTITVGDDSFTIPAKIAPDAPGFPKLAGSEDVKIGDKVYPCKIYHYTTKAAAETGRNTQGLPAEVTIWLTPDVPGGVIRRQISLTIKASYDIEDTFIP
jgi:hypothetical protein